MNDLMSNLVGNDCTFELDDFGRPRVCNESETIKNTLLYVLFSRPGQHPSLPYIGMDIQSKLYSFYDEINEQELQDTISSQCRALSQYFESGNIIVKKMMYTNMPSLIININVDSNVSSTNRIKKEFLIGLSVTDLNELLYNITERDI